MLTATNYKVSGEMIQQANHTMLEVDSKLTLNQQSGNFFYDPWVIKDQYKNTIWEQLLSVLPSDIGEARLIKLSSHENYTAHADMDDRYHLNIKSNLGYLIDLEHNEMFLLKPDGIWYEMNAGVIHSAANFGNSDRVQIVVRKLLKKNLLNNPINITIIPEKVTGYRFIFDNVVSPWLNMANKNNLVSNFSYVGETVNMDIECDELLKLRKLLPSIFKIV